MASLKACTQHMLDKALPDIAALIGRTPEQLRVEVKGDNTDSYSCTGYIKNILTEAEKREYKYDSTAAAFSMSAFHGCCGMCIAYHMAVMNPFLNKKLGTLLEAIRIDIATLAGYSKMMATTIQSMHIEHKILKKLGWIEQHKAYTNIRTANEINVWFRDTDAIMANFANREIIVNYDDARKMELIKVPKGFNYLYKQFVPTTPVAAAEKVVEELKIGPVTVTRTPQVAQQQLNSERRFYSVRIIDNLTGLRDERDDS